MNKTYRISLWSITGLVLLIGGLSLFAFYSWSRVGQINQASTDIERNWLPSTQLLGRMEVNALTYRVAAMQHVLSLRDEQMQSYEQEMAAALAALEQAQQDYEPLIVTDEERDLYESFTTAWASHLEESQGALALSNDNQNQEAVRVLRQRPQQLYDEASEHLENLILLNVETAASISRAGDDLLRGFQLALVTLVILGGAFLVLVLFDLFAKPDRTSSTSHLP